MPNSRRLLMAHSGVSTSQTIALSSNDFDYTFDGGGEWPVAGNSLGDGTVGGMINHTGGNSAGSGLITLDGDFTIAFTLTSETQLNWGIHAIDEDDTRTTAWDCGASSMTNSYFYAHTARAYNGASFDSVTLIADGSACEITRVGDTITITDDGSTTKQWTSAYTGTVRFFIGADGSPFTGNIDDLFITDHSKVQRDGFINETHNAYLVFGDLSATRKHAGARFTATRTGDVSSLILRVEGHTTTMTDCVCSIYTDSSGSPGTLVGSASTGISISSTGNKTLTPSGTAPSLTKGTKYWFVATDNGGDGDLTLSLQTSSIDEGCGTNDTLTSISDTETGSFMFEVVYDTTGEPTPDHDTLFLLQNEEADTSTTFTDAGPLGLTVTAVNNVQHDTAQTLGYGTSSILFDGTGDELTLADNDRWHELVDGDFTIDLLVRFNTLSGKTAIINHQSSNAWSGINFYMQTDTSNVIQVCAGNNGGAGISVNSSGSVSTGTNYHLAMIKIRNKLIVAIDGSMNSTTGAMAGTNVSSTVTIGTRSGIADLDGWIKRVRISKVARWDANFTPPTASYPTS